MRDERFKAVSVLDPALDMTVQETVQYYGSRDFSLVRVLPGEKAMVFHCREVPHALWESYVAAADNVRERNKRAFQAGVEKVENLAQNDGTTIPSWAPTLRLERFKDVVIMSDEEAALFSPAEREEIGSVIYTNSFLPRRIKCSFQLPPSCLELLGTRTFRPAVASQLPAQTQSNEKPSASGTPSQDAIASA